MKPRCVRLSRLSLPWECWDGPLHRLEGEVDGHLAVIDPDWGVPGTEIDGDEQVVLAIYGSTQ